MLKRSFTLIELVVVLLVISILTVAVVPAAFRALERSRVSAAIADYRSIRAAAINYYSHTASWPLDNSGPSYFLSNTGGLATWDGPYLDKWPMGKWPGSVITFQNDSDVNWDINGGGDDARYLQVTNGPSAKAQDIDAKLDGSIGDASGYIRYGAGVTVTLYMLVSTNVSVN